VCVCVCVHVCVCVCAVCVCVVCVGMGGAVNNVTGNVLVCVRVWTHIWINFSGLFSH